MDDAATGILTFNTPGVVSTVVTVPFINVFMSDTSPPTDTLNSVGLKLATPTDEVVAFTPKTTTSPVLGAVVTPFIPVTEVTAPPPPPLKAIKNWLIYSLRFVDRQDLQLFFRKGFVLEPHSMFLRYLSPLHNDLFENQRSEYPLEG